MRSNYLFTSESVSEGHPDKVADQISDAIVDLFLSKDPEARIACETLTTTQLVVLAGEIRGKGIMDEDGNWAPGVAARRSSRPSATPSSGSATSRTASTGRRFDFENNLHAPVGAHRAGRRRRAATRTRAPATRASCSAIACRRDARPDAGDALLQPQDPRADGRRPPFAARRRSSSPTPRAR